MSERARAVSWPDGRRFAFAIFDDTDLATVANVGPVYDFLTSIGVLATKSVWTVTGDGTPAFGGATCDDPDYLAWTQGLPAQGHEIASHGVTYTTAPRDLTRRGLDRFRELYGHDPVAMANHSGCDEAIYWGSARVSGAQRALYDVMTRYRRRGRFRGHIEGDPLFWGDLCKERIRYVRNFTFLDIDTLAACPEMPYHDPDRPWVNLWFAASEGRDAKQFIEQIRPANIDRLEASGGACIMYTHFASGFLRDGVLDPVFVERMTQLAARGGWFVPVSTLLDHLRAQKGDTVIDRRGRSRLERRWLQSKFRVGST